MRKYIQSILYVLLTVVLSFILTACGNTIVAESTNAPQNELHGTLPSHSLEPSEPSIPQTTVNSSLDVELVVSDADMHNYDLAVELLKHYASGAEVRNLAIRDEESGNTFRGNAALDYIYKLFTRLHDYRNSEEYLDRFIIIKDVILGERWTTADSLGSIVDEYYYYQYNAQGQLVKYWDLQNRVDYADMDCYFYAYDEEGRISSIQVSLDYDDPVYMTITPSYDHTGKLTSEQIEPNSVLIMYTYNSNGQLTSKVCTSGSGEFTTVSTTQYFYSNGLLTQEVFEGYYNQNHVVDRVITDYLYDGTGNLTGKTVTAELAMMYDYPGFTTMDHYNYEVDQDGRIVRELLTFGQTVNPDGSVDEPAEYTREIEYIYGDYYIYQFDLLPVTAEYASNSLLSSPNVYDEYRERESDYQVQIAFFATSSVTNFQYIELLFDGEGFFIPGECLYMQDSLTPSRPLVITTTFAGMLPDRGICFVDSAGNVRYYGITQSGEDGSIILFEI